MSKTHGINRRDAALLVGLAVIALLAGLTFARADDRASANTLFQSPPTNTPDPNSPLPTPTPTATPFPTDTPTEIPSDTPTSLPGDTATPFPSETPTEFPTETPTEFPTETPTAVDIAPLPTDTPPASPLQLPAAVPAAQPSPDQQPTVTLLTATPMAAGAPRAVVIVPPAEPEPEPAFNTVLFIDNLVIAFGYIWICLGALVVLSLALGAVLFLTRRSGTQAQPAAAAPGAAAPAPPSPSPASAPPAPPRSSQRVAARHRRGPRSDQ